MCLVVTEGKKNREKRVKEERGKEMKLKMHPSYMFGKGEGRENKINIFKYNIFFYLNNPIKSRRFDFVMDKIEILNFLQSGPPKVALILYSFFIIFFQFGQMRKVDLDRCSFLRSSPLFFPIIPIKKRKLSCQHNLL